MIQREKEKKKEMILLNSKSLFINLDKEIVTKLLIIYR